MSRFSTGFVPGDVIEIKYRLWRGYADEAVLVDKWLRAEILDTPSDGRPLARLADGQVTEIRDYMRWRVVARASLGAHRRMAA